MKRFIISVLCVSVFFIGLGGLVEKTSAKFQSDAKALELVRLARIAIGGEPNIKNVRGMTIAATTTHFVNNGAKAKQGNLEINFELPNRFSKMVRIGNPDADGAATIEEKNFDVVITKKDGNSAEIVNPGEGKKIVIVKKKDGTVLTEDIKPVEGERKIFVNKDGVVKEIDPNDKDFVFESKPGDGAAVFHTKDGKNIIVNKEVKVAGGAHGQSDLLRTVFSLLLTAPEGTDVSYKYLGESLVDGFAAEIVEVLSGGASFKLFLDKSSYLPRMISYTTMPEVRVFKIKKDGAAETKVDGDKKVFTRNIDAPKASEFQLKLSDYRSVGGLLLPYRWTKTSEGKTHETVDVQSYDINPANLADKFKDKKVFVRTPKQQ